MFIIFFLEQWRHKLNQVFGYTSNTCFWSWHLCKTNSDYNQSYSFKSVYLSYTTYNNLKIPTLKTPFNKTSFFTFPVVVCSGTQNVLSTTGNSELQYNLMKEMYTGCEIVMGNLEITMMDHNRDFSFLQVRL